MDFRGYVINVLSAVLAIEYIDHAFEKKYGGCKRRLIFAAGTAVYFLIVSGINYFLNFEGILCVLYGVCLIGYGVIALKGSFFDKAVLGLMWILVLLLGSFSVYGVLGVLTGKSMENMLELDGNLFVCGVLAASVVKFLMGRLIVKLYGKRAGLHRREDWMLIGALALILFTGLGIFQLELGGLGGRARYGLIIGILAGEFGGILLLENVYRRLGEYQREKMEREFCEEQEKKQKESMLDVYRIGREINHLRHDMNGKLDVLYRLWKKGSYSEAGKKLEELQKEAARYPELPRETGNEGLDVALMRTILRCREEKIHFTYVVMGAPGKVDSMDMGILMYNLFDNAVEACMRTTEAERRIEFFLRESGGETEIRLENSIAESVLKKNPELKSRKADRERHGFGMETINSIINKYQGKFICGEEDGRFIQEIYLRHRQAPEG